MLEDIKWNCVIFKLKVVCRWMFDKLISYVESTNETDE